MKKKWGEEIEERRGGKRSEENRKEETKSKGENIEK